MTRKPALSLSDIDSRLDDQEWLQQLVSDENERKLIEPKPRYLYAVKEPMHFVPNPDEWRPIPTFANYEMNYLGHLRYRGSSNTIPWVDMDGSKWYELQSKISTDDYLVHIFPMITLVKKTFPEIGLGN